MNLSTIFYYGFLAFVIGMSVSSAVLLPPLRRWNQSGYGRKVAEGIGFALFVAVAFTIYDAFGEAQDFVDMTLPALPSSLSQGEQQNVKDAIAREIWMRLIAPPSFKQYCYTHQQMVCGLADRVVRNSSADRVRDLSFRDDTWADYLSFPALYFIFAFMGSVAVIFGSSRLDRALPSARHTPLNF